MTDKKYEDFVRARITQLRMEKGVSEHRMSLDLDKSGSYVRAITSGRALPSLRELFRFCDYFEITPAEFFEPLKQICGLYGKICVRLQSWTEEDLKKVDIMLDLIEK